LVSNEEGDFDFGGTQEKWIVAYSLWKKDQTNAVPHLEELSVAKILERLRKHQPKAGDNDPKRRHEYDRLLFMAKILLTQRFVNPLACVALAMFAFPLGVMEMGKSRLNNVSLGLVAIFVYYAFVLAVERIARSKLAMPELVLPLPALAFIITGAYFVRCVRLERIPFPLRMIRAAIQTIRPKKY
jgi:lipopolysaccharide export LptBFGC system permease protein LptF